MIYFNKRNYILELWRPSSLKQVYLVIFHNILGHQVDDQHMQANVLSWIRVLEILFLIWAIFSSVSLPGLNETTKKKPLWLNCLKCLHQKNSTEAKHSIYFTLNFIEELFWGWIFLIERSGRKAIWKWNSFVFKSTV